MAAAAVDARARTAAVAIRLRTAAPVAVVGALLAFHVWLAAPMDGPLLSDGTGYLANARWLAGIAEEFTQGRTGFYYPGYSLVVSPVLRLVDDARAAYDGVLLVNGLLGSTSFLVYLALARRFGLRGLTALLAALCAAVYPAVLLQASIEWSESLFHLLFALLVLALHRLLERPGALVAAAVGGTATALYATHPRGLGVVPVIAVALVALAWRGPLPRREAIVGLAALVVSFAAVRLLSGLLIDALWADDRPVTEGDVLSRLTEPELLWGTVVRSIGQAWYLLVASAGLAGAGAVWLVRRWRQPFPIVLLAALVATVAASSLMMSDATRVDHFVYGRYNEGFLPVLLVVGAAGLAEVRGRAALVLAGSVVGAVVVLGAVTVWLNGGDRFAGAVQPLNVLGILVWETARDRVDVLRVSVGAGVVAFVALALRAVTVRASLVVAAAFFVVSALVVRADVLGPWKAPFENLHELPEAVRSLPVDADVAYITAAYIPQVGNFYQEELWDRWAGFWDEGEPPPADLVIGTMDPPVPGARMVFPEPGRDQALWVLPGSVQRRLTDAGFVARPLVDPVAVVSPPQVVTIGRGETRTVHVRLEHPPGGAPWPSLADGDGAVRVVLNWPDGSVAIGDLRKTMLPGEAAEVPVVLTAPDEPGDHVVGVNVLQEGGPVFAGGVPITVHVR